MAKAAPKTVKAPTKTQIFANIAEATGLTKKQVGEVFDALDAEIIKTLSGRGESPSFTLPGVCKFVVKKKPATKAGEKMNPFTKEMMMVAAKPASRQVRIRPLKKLKDAVA